MTQLDYNYKIGYRSNLEPTKQKPYTSLMGELNNVSCKYISENWILQDGT